MLIVNSFQGGFTLAEGRGRGACAGVQIRIKFKCRYKQSNIIKERSVKEVAYIIVVDFSKAFDRCRNATLLKKLSNNSIRGKTLRLIKDMYTDAEVELHINGKTGTRFKVTCEVAQGCALSPLLFDT